MANGEKQLDMRGRACPEPVMETRKALADSAVTRLSVVVDNDGAVENVSRTARNMGCEVTVEAALEGTFTIIIERAPLASGEQPVQDTTPVSCTPRTSLVVLFSQDTFGNGDPDLGRALLLAFAGTLPQIAPRPSTVIFLNAGAKLVCEETPFVDHVKTLEAAGTKVLVCGTCLDFYNLDKDLKVGTVSNMMEIAETLAAADRIIRP